jgi:ribonuclease Z
MLENVPVLKLERGGLTIEGFSRAAVQSYWRVAELKIGIDLGAHPWDFMGLPTIFITHTHLDHIAALAVYVARRRMMKMEPPIIYVPNEAVTTCQGILKLFTRLDRGRLPCEIIGLEPGTTIDLNRETVVEAVRTRHSVVSLGYIVYNRRHKLKPEYLSLSGPQIRDLRQSGVEITHEVKVPVIAFTGDTQPAGLDENPVFYESKILVTEMTFVASSHRKEKIHKHGHMHLDDFIVRQDRFQNDLVIASHFSTRYSDKQIRRIVEKRLPESLREKLHLWL